MRHLGDSAVLIDVADHRAAQALAAAVRAGWPDATEVVPAATTLGVVGPPPPPLEPVAVAPGRHHRLPVALDGEDLAACGLRAAEVAEALAATTLEVAFLGFMPGFAYLVGLPPLLAGVGRRQVPRSRVPAGSLAVAAGYAGIYPSESPGGWQLVGHCPTPLFDPDRPPHALLLPGDTVTLEVVPSAGWPTPPARLPLDGTGIEIVEPGLQSLVEDLGRRGAAFLGVPRAGAADDASLRVANLAVGNGEGAAGVEVTGTLRLRPSRPVLLATNGDLEVDGTRHRPGRVVAAGAGQLVTVTGWRAVLAIGGGVEVPVRFESRSADAVSGLAPGPLRAGDRLGIGPPPARARRSFSPLAGEGPLRILPGPDDGGPGALAALEQGRFTVAAASDRTGWRLEGSVLPAGSARVASHAVVPGAIQLTPSGQPVVLGPDCGPVGGYAVVATVISADCRRLAGLRPGDPVCFRAVSLDEAAAARRDLERAVAAAVEGYFPTTVA